MVYFDALFVMGGVLSSGLFHDDEKGVPDSAFIEFSYGEQSEDEYKQLDTENDQKGDTAVEHIFKKTKYVYWSESNGGVHRHRRNP